jgi:hypothetical protein
MPRLGAAALGSVVLVLLMAAPAQAAQRFAAPMDTGAGDCSSAADACDLQEAVEMAGVGDEVIVESGTYNEGTDPLVFPPSNLNVHGGAGPKPVLNFTDITEGMSGSSVAVNVSAGSSVSWLRIVSADPTVIGHNALFATGAQIERVEVEAVAAACVIHGAGARLRDSFCRTTSGGPISAAIGGASGVTSIVKFRNVTAVATGTAGLTAFASGGGNVTVDAKNVIADGAPDAQALTLGGGNTANLTLCNSNYATTADPGTSTTITPAGSATNQTPPPMLGANLFTQLPGSVTVNAGVTDADTGTEDIDGDPRAQGAAIDIGADESAENPPPPGGAGACGTFPANPVPPSGGQTPLASPTGQPAPSCTKKKKKKRKKRSASAAKKKKKKKKC